MNKIEYYTPDGETLINIDIKVLKQLIIEGNKSYWTAQNDQGMLTFFENNKKKSQLILTFSEKLGFQLEFRDIGVGYYVALNPQGDFKHTATVYVGGDPLILPTRFFSSREVAWTAAEYFCKTGKKNEQIEWGKRDEQNWHYGLIDSLVFA